MAYLEEGSKYSDCIHNYIVSLEFYILEQYYFV